MAHYAKLNENNIVQEVIVFDNDIEPGVPQAPLPEDWRWMQTSYNANIRKKFASKGDTYNEELDAFVSPKPANSWTLNTSTCKWEAPVAKPSDDQDYNWNESTQSWDLDPD
jgi:hypothetical protein